MLEGTVARLCRTAGISGYKTNHSLRATTATRLYHAGVDEQLVMERTGHRSLEGVRSYKRTSVPQQEGLSDILNGNSSALAIPTSSNSVQFSQQSLNNVAVQVNRPPVFNFQSCSVTINYANPPQ